MLSPDLQPECEEGKRERPVRGPEPCRGRAGLTLIELAVTLTVLMLAAVVAVPSFIRFQQASQVQWAARRTVALAAEARGLAVSGDSIVRLEYDAQAHGLRMAVEPPEDDPADPPGSRGEPPVGERRTPDTRFLPFPLDVEAAVEKDRASEDASLHFYPDGRADAARMWLEREGFRPLVLVMNARTGRFRIEEQPE